MKKIQVLGVFAAVLALSAMAVASASAAIWEKNGVEVTKTESAPAHGELILHHTGGLAGTILILCKGLTEGTVGASGKDETTEVLGEAGEKNGSIKCVVHTGNFVCPAGTTVTITANGLPWTTQLVGSGTSLVDKVTGTKGEAGYTTNCNGTAVTCNKNETANWTSNGANGAIFEDKGTSEASCTDGGKGTILGKVEVLGFTAK